MSRITMYGEIEEIIDEVEFDFNNFRNFDTVDHPPPDHHYHGGILSPITSKLKAWTKPRIEKELRSLEKNIPDWIFVRSYKHRIDLMRVAIVGPPNTDYRHCLFFFDVELPLNYPSKPPKVHYLSYGIDLNPNLRVDGRVALAALSESKVNCCISGRRGKWDPEESDLLRVFHAIRGAMAVRGPGCRGVFEAACRVTMRIAREPPADFGELVSGYLRRIGHGVLTRFGEEEWYDGVGVDLFVEMFKVFEGNGGYCKHHICFLRAAASSCGGGGLDLESIIGELEGGQMEARTSYGDGEGRYDIID